MECIILAGGLGTRLQGVIGPMPKCMATVAGQPFLYHLLQFLDTQNVTRVILSLGYKHELVENWLIATDWEFEIDIVVEHEPLGTGGGISLAMQQAKTDNVLVLNGDTMFRAELGELMRFHLSKNSATTLALKNMQQFERYGVVLTDETSCIQSFREKQFVEQGLINGGIYVLNRAAFSNKKMPVQYSFEKDYLEKFVSEKQFFGFESDAYFIDIGIPEDFEKAQNDFPAFTQTNTI